MLDLANVLRESVQMDHLRAVDVVFRPGEVIVPVVGPCLPVGAQKAAGGRFRGLVEQVIVPVYPGPFTFKQFPDHFLLGPAQRIETCKDELAGKQFPLFTLQGLPGLAIDVSLVARFNILHSLLHALIVDRNEPVKVQIAFHQLALRPVGRPVLDASCLVDVLQDGLGIGQVGIQLVKILEQDMCPF